MRKEGGGRAQQGQAEPPAARFRIGQQVERQDRGELGQQLAHAEAVEEVLELQRREDPGRERSREYQQAWARLPQHAQEQAERARRPAEAHQRLEPRVPAAQHAHPVQEEPREAVVMPVVGGQQQGQHRPAGVMRLEDGNDGPLVPGRHVAGQREQEDHHRDGHHDGERQRQHPRRADPRNERAHGDGEVTTLVRAPRDSRQAGTS